MLPRWPDRQWRYHVRQNDYRKDRQCIIPEVSRCTRLWPEDGMGDRSGGGASPGVRAAGFEERSLPVFWNEDLAVVNLGDLKRMHAAAYERLLLETWPGNEGLKFSQELTGGVAQLQKLERGNWFFVVDTRPGVWQSAAGFFRLWPHAEHVIRGAYRGSLRLRWRGAILHVLMANSPLIPTAYLNVTVKLLGPMAFSQQRPVLRAPTVAVGQRRAIKHVDASCQEAKGSRLFACLLF
eukprot:TRINITY_DN29496_c0_g1_i1.p1 TRINITY_DN29496_c0_g1~~TRINITY_DN29496_c0_g1_i1.p1  ORF type:complete len:237 (+),score=25.61 TRINITY_DN29496_c0_g1_i1:193-903(+)